MKNWPTSFGHESRGGNYDQSPTISLGLTLWEGDYEGKRDHWLHWVDAEGKLIPTRKEPSERDAIARNDPSSFCNKNGNARNEWRRCCDNLAKIQTRFDRQS